MSKVKCEAAKPEIVFTYDEVDGILWTLILARADAPTEAARSVINRAICKLANVKPTDTVRFEGCKE